MIRIRPFLLIQIETNTEHFVWGLFRIPFGSSRNCSLRIETRNWIEPRNVSQSEAWGENGGCWNNGIRDTIKITLSKMVFNLLSSSSQWKRKRVSVSWERIRERERDAVPVCRNEKTRKHMYIFWHSLDGPPRCLWLSRTIWLWGIKHAPWLIDLFGWGILGTCILTVGAYFIDGQFRLYLFIFLRKRVQISPAAA